MLITFSFVLVDYIHVYVSLIFNFSKVKTVLFVPYALHDRDGYASVARKAYTEMGRGI